MDTLTNARTGESIRPLRVETNPPTVTLAAPADIREADTVVINDGHHDSAFIVTAVSVCDDVATIEVCRPDDLLTIEAARAASVRQSQVWASAARQAIAVAVAEYGETVVAAKLGVTRAAIYQRLQKLAAK
jgi:hypothetical protein